MAVREYLEYEWRNVEVIDHSGHKIQAGMMILRDMKVRRLAGKVQIQGICRIEKIVVEDEESVIRNYDNFYMLDGRCYTFVH